MCDETRLKDIEKTLRKLMAALGNGYSPMTSTTPGAGDPCGGKPYCPAPTVSPQTQAANRAASRIVSASPVIAALGIGLSSPAVTITAPGEMISLAIVDLVSTVPALDDLLIVGTVGGVERFRFNGGVFSRGNANACTTACGQELCLWPTESVSIVVTNQSLAVLNAGATMRLDARRAFVGEPGFACPECV